MNYLFVLKQTINLFFCQNNAIKKQRKYKAKKLDVTAAFKKNDEGKLLLFFCKFFKAKSLMEFNFFSLNIFKYTIFVNSLMVDLQQWFVTINVK